MERQRIVYIDVAKGLAIFLVVLQHHELPTVLLDWVNSFLMVLFFVLSGYFWHLRPIKDEVKNGLRFLIMPLWITKIVWVILLLFLYFKSGVYTGPNLKDWLMGGLLEKGYFCMSVIWFLYALFWGRLLLCFIQTYLLRWTTLCVLSLFFMPFIFRDWWYSKFGCVSFPFYILHGMVVPLLLMIGNYLRQVSFFEIKSSFIKILFILALILMPIPLLFVSLYFPYLFWNVVASTISTIGFVFVCKYIAECKECHYFVSFLSFVGKNTLAILCFHAIEMATQADRVLPSFVPLYIKGVCMFFVILLFLYFLRKITLIRTLFNIK